MISITVIPVLKDNYAYLLEGDNGETAVLDPGEAGPVIETLDERNIQLDYVLNTHHHGDHIAGNAALLERYGAKLAAPEAETARIPGIDVPLQEGSTFSFDGEAVEIIETPGHTRGHICFFFPKSKLLFSGDTLFLMGCGRLFEGTAEEMWNSLCRLMRLPDDTLIYCGHEYTLDGARFCVSVEPDNQDLRARYEAVKQKRSRNEPTVPGRMALEKKTNVFLRAGSAEAFGALREQKNNF